MCWWNLTLHSYCWIIIARGGLRWVFWGGGGGEKCISCFTINLVFRKMFLWSWNVKQNGVGRWGGGDAPRHATPRPSWGVALGREMTHFFLWPWPGPMTGENFGTIRLGAQKLSYENLGGGRRKNLNNKILTKPYGRTYGSNMKLFYSNS